MQLPFQAKYAVDGQPPVHEVVEDVQAVTVLLTKV